MPVARSTKLFIGLLMVVAVLLGYNYFAQPFANLTSPEPALVTIVPEEQKDKPTQVEEIFSSLTPEQRVSQMMAVSLVIDDSIDVINATGAANVATSSGVSATNSAETSKPPTASWFEKTNPGFLVLFGTNIRKSQALEMVSTYRSLPIAQGNILLPAVAVDHEGGNVQRLSGIGYTQMPSLRDFCELPLDERLELLTESSLELQETGVNIVFAPVVDVAANNPVLRNRTCSGDTLEVASRAAEVSQEYLNRSIMPVFKHFPGIGQVSVDLHRSFARTTVSGEMSQLFRDLLADFPDAGVMITHVGVINSQSADVPCSVSNECVGALHKLFPRTLTFTDGLNMVGASYTGETPRTLVERSILAAKAGNDVLVYENGVSEQELNEVKEALLEAYQQDRIFAATVDNSVKKIIDYKKNYNLMVME